MRSITLLLNDLSFLGFLGGGGTTNTLLQMPHLSSVMNCI